MPPDPLLATIIDAVTGEDGKGLAGCSDDGLTCECDLAPLCKR